MHITCVKLSKRSLMDITQLDVEQLELAANMLKAVAHPKRMEILAYLEKEGQMTVTQIHEKLGIEQSTASHHLGILKDKGILSSRREGKNTFYSLKYTSFSNIVECASKCAAIK